MTIFRVAKLLSLLTGGTRVRDLPSEAASFKRGRHLSRDGGTMGEVSVMCGILNK